MECKNSQGSVDFTIILVSSANKTGSVNGLIVCGRSFIYIKKAVVQGQSLVEHLV
jgi:hypothetical protein